MKHRFKCLLYGRGGTKGKAGNDRASGKYVGVAGKHVGCHRAPRRKPGDENLAPIDTMIGLLACFALQVARFDFSGGPISLTFRK